MAADSFEAMIARLEALMARVPEAARIAVHEAQQPAFEASQNAVPTKTETLKQSGIHPEAEIEGTRAIDMISYGNEDTLTDWHGLGYEIFVHEGTDHHTYEIPPNKFLEQAVLSNQASFLEREGAAFAAALEGSG